MSVLIRASANLLAPLTEAPIKIRQVLNVYTRMWHALHTSGSQNSSGFELSHWKPLQQARSQYLPSEMIEKLTPFRVNKRWSLKRGDPVGTLKRCWLEFDGVLFGQRFSSAVLEHLKVYVRPMSVKYVWFESRTRMTLPHSSHQSAYLQLASKLAVDALLPRVSAKPSPAVTQKSKVILETERV